LPNLETQGNCQAEIWIESSRMVVIKLLSSLTGLSPESVISSALLIGLSDMAEKQNKLSVFRRLNDREKSD
jgi:hypothetical protein